MSDERRKFQRIVVDKHAEVRFDSSTIQCELMDISFKGAMLYFEHNQECPKVGQHMSLNPVRLVLTFGCTGKGVV